PVATDDGKPLRGLVRYEMVADTAAETQPLSRREGHGSYPPTADGEAKGTLTVRARETDERQPVLRDQWALARASPPKAEKGVAGTHGQVRLRLKGGFKPGHIYELICEAEGPIIQGLGYAATRDLISFLRHDASAHNPLRDDAGKPVITRAHGFGV